MAVACLGLGACISSALHPFSPSSSAKAQRRARTASLGAASGCALAVVLTAAACLAGVPLGMPVGAQVGSRVGCLGRDAMQALHVHSAACHCRICAAGALVHGAHIRALRDLILAHPLAKRCWS